MCHKISYLSQIETLSHWEGCVAPASSTASRAGREADATTTAGLERSRHFPAADVVTLELAIERCPADAQHFSGEGFVAFHLFEDSLDGGALDVLEIGGREPGGATLSRDPGRRECLR